ncbi:peptidoglycan DD-metalloendopeptidase family protein [Ectothiorhodospiraceae bacterium WFHF3C12]|nr:peptidoglycan DD-metalloendopeptidase family protein [Ectothiorhodospiraceae bacterium WFHF3C12]
MPKHTRITDLDFKPRRSKPTPALARSVRRLRLHWVILAASGLTGVALLTSTHHDAVAVDESTTRDLAIGPHPQADIPLALPPRETSQSLTALDALPGGPVGTDPAAPQEPSETVETEQPSAEPAEAPAGEWKSFEVRRGDSLAAIFSRAGFSARTVYELMQAGEPAQALKRIYPGDVLKLKVVQEELAAVHYRVDESVMLEIDRADDGGYLAEMVSTPLERRRTHASAVIDTSLFAAGKRAGLNDRLIMELAGIFGWDVDFALDIRKGDAFTVIYEELYRDGRKVRNGEIIAAEFINEGNRFQALRYTDPNGRTAYYAPDGRSMKKPFLRSPVNFSRVSSNFNPERLHPVLKTRRPHMGTDYAASPGTPIKAAGDGKIIHRGRKGGYGNTVIIRHGSRYSTLYAHMSRFAGGMSTGSRVEQGQIIGYVGSSGLATGPHLHYEFRVDGVHRNPRTVELPDADPINQAFKSDFLETTENLRAQLDVIHRTELALRGD